MSESLARTMLYQCCDIAYGTLFVYTRALMCIHIMLLLCVVVLHATACS